VSQRRIHATGYRAAEAACLPKINRQGTSLERQAGGLDSTPHDYP
jgi:hypothetical protein